MSLQIFHRCYPSFSPETVVARRWPMLRLCRTISRKVQSELQSRGVVVPPLRLPPFCCIMTKLLLERQDEHKEDHCWYCCWEEREEQEHVAGTRIAVAESVDLREEGEEEEGRGGGPAIPSTSRAPPPPHPQLIRGGRGSDGSRDGILLNSADGCDCASCSC